MNRTSRLAVCLALAASAAAGLARAQQDKEFSADGYTISLVGRSGKLKFSVDATNTTEERFLQLQQDDLEEVVSADGSSLSPAYAVPSWASQDFEWTDDAATCGEPGENAAIKFCDELTVKVGSNGAGAPTAEVFSVGELTNASYFHSCACAEDDGVLVPGEGDQVRQPFDDNYVRETHGFCLKCLDACVSCAYVAATDADPASASCTAAAAADACDGAQQLLVASAVAGSPAANQTAGTLCEQGAVCACVNATHAAACVADACEAGFVKVTDAAVANATTLNDVTPLDESDCAFQAEHELKFSIEVSGWPWKDAASNDNELAYGVEIKGTGAASGNGTDEGGRGVATVSTDDNLVLLSSNDYIRCDNGAACGSWRPGPAPTARCAFDGGDEDCCVVADGVREGGIVTQQGSKTVVTYRFVNSSGASGVCYDPSVGIHNVDDEDDDGDDSAASLAAPPGAAAVTLLGVLLAAAAVL